MALIDLSRNGTVRFLVGMQGSGKTTYAKETYPDALILSGDDFSTPKKMLQELHKALHRAEPQIVLDRTFPSEKSRGPYLELAAMYPNFTIKYTVFAWEMNACIENICYRALTTGTKVIPYCALQAFVKAYEPPPPGAEYVPMYRRPRPEGGRSAAFFDHAVRDAPQLASAVAYYRKRGFLCFWLGDSPPDAVVVVSAFHEVYLCDHGRGRCLCKPPLPYFGIAADVTYGLDFAKCVVFGSDAFAQRLGMKRRSLE